MKKAILKLYLLVALICCFVGFAYFAVTMINNQKMVNNYIQNELYYSSGKYANEFTILLQKHEDTVGIASQYAGKVFQNWRISDNQQEFQEDWNDLYSYLEMLLKKNDSLLSVYFTFDLDEYSTSDEIWLHKDSKDNAVRIPTNSKTPEDVTKKYGSGFFDYYYCAIQSGQAWMDPFHDSVLNDDLVTYSKAVYDSNGNFIGVIGADMSVSNILRTVKSMKIHDDGQAMILGKEGNYIAGTPGTEAETLIKKTTTISKKDVDTSAVDDTEHGTVTYTYQGKEYIGGFSTLSNGWVLQVAVPKRAINAPFDRFIGLLIVSVAFLIVTTVILIISISRWSLTPFINGYKEMDIMFANQSRQAKLGEMVGNVAHQWKQPLNSISITLANIEDDLKLKELDEARFKQYKDSIGLSIDSMSETLENFTNYLKPDREKVVFCINDQVKRALRLIDESIKINCISVVQEGRENLNSFGYPNEFTQSVFNIITNARDAIINSKTDERTIRIKYELLRQSEDGGTLAVLSIFNNGKKIPEKILNQVFKPYFTTKEDCGGTGLGLYISKQIVEEHMGGKLEIFNLNEGVCCQITLISKDK